MLRRHGVLLIADEVICAFGRLGAWFGGECFGVEPDLVTLAKGLTSGYVPMSACLVSERVYEPFQEHAEGLSFAHGYTYSGHPVAAAAGLANLEKHVESIRTFGKSPVVALNRFAADTDEEIDIVRARCDELGTLLAREEGKTQPEGKGEVYRSGQFFTYYAAEALRQASYFTNSTESPLVHLENL